MKKHWFLFAALAFWLIGGVAVAGISVWYQYASHQPSWSVPVGEAVHAPEYFFLLAILPCLLSWIWFIRELRQYVDA